MALVSCDQSFRKGNEYVKNWMSSQCKIAWISVKDDAYASTTMANSLSEFTRFLAERVPVKKGTVHRGGCLNQFFCCASVWARDTPVLDSF